VHAGRLNRMVTLLLDSTQLEVALSPVERALARRSDPVRVERADIRKVQLTEDAWTWLRGVPSPGTLVRGAIAMGTWASASGNDFVVMRRRRAAVVVDLVDGAEFARLVLTTRHGLALVQALRLEAEDAPTEVSDMVAGHARVSPPRRRPARGVKPATA
jgi:hypothetical protein